MFLGLAGASATLAVVGVAGAPRAAATSPSQADQLVAIAESQLGPGGADKKYPSQNIYNQLFYGAPTSGAWCATFVSWCAAQVGIGGILIPNHAYTPTGVAWFKAKNGWHEGTAGIRRGDIVYFDFDDDLHRVQHVGIVTSAESGGYINTIEGNTSAKGSQSNGGYVATKQRPCNSVIVGYGRPAYADVADVPVPPPVIPEPVRAPDEPVIYLATSSSAYVFSGWRYLQGSSGILRPLSALEWDAYSYTHPEIIGREAAWSGADLLALARRDGMYEFVGTESEGDPLGLTGRVIGRDAPANGDAPTTGGDSRRYL